MSDHYKKIDKDQQTKIYDLTKENKSLRESYSILQDKNNFLKIS